MGVLKMSDTPHLAWPLRRNTDGTYAVVDQDSPEHLEQRVALILSTPAGSLVDAPTLGRPGLAFTTGGVTPEQIRAVVQDAEPRVPVDIVDDGITNLVQTLGVGVTRERGDSE